MLEELLKYFKVKGLNFSEVYKYFAFMAFIVIKKHNDVFVKLKN